jgi:quinol monooxygenase YgiN
MFIRIWHFRVTSANAAAFREAYGPSADWDRLFRLAQGYLGTELFESVETPGAFVTIDRWRDQAAWDAFRLDHDAAYRALDAACAPLADEEQQVCDVNVNE